MLDKIRLATPEEIAPIAEASDLTPRSVVYAFENKKTGVPDLMVVRQCIEFDPMLMAPESGIQRRVAFTWGLETVARNAGNTEYYFNLRPEDTEWIANVRKWGGEQITPSPELRFKKLL